MLSGFLRILEYEVNTTYGRASLPYLTEAFASLHHPEAVSALRELVHNPNGNSSALRTINILTAAISSFSVLENHGKQVNGSAVNAWRAIANITHGHKRYRFETQRQYGVTDEGKPRVELRSFFEAFGGKRLSHISKNHPFHSAYLFHGRGYLRRGEAETPAMKGLDDACVVVRYRAGEVFFDPSIGYIFTRIPRFGNRMRMARMCS